MLLELLTELINQYVLEGINSRDFGNTWIDGNDREKEGEWKWIEDGSSLKFEDCTKLHPKYVLM